MKLDEEIAVFISRQDLEEWIDAQLKEKGLERAGKIRVCPTRRDDADDTLVSTTARRRSDIIKPPWGIE